MKNNSAQAYRVVRKLDDGQEVFVASCEDYCEASELIESLREFWPGDYSIHPTVSGRPNIPPQASHVQF